MNGVDDTRRRGKKARLRLHANRRKRKWNTGRVIYFDGTRTRLISKEESDKIANNGCAQTADSGPSVSCTDHPPCRDSRDDCYANTNGRSSELSVTPQRLSLENSEPGCSYWPNIYMEKATPEKMASNSSDLSSANGCQDELDIHTQAYILDISDVSLLPLSPEGDVNSSRQSEFPAFSECTESYTTAPEPNTSISTPAIIEGRHIFDINNLFSEISRISRHSKIFDCSFDNMVLLKEERKGMESIYHFECSMCGLKEKISSEFPKSTKGYMSINDSLVSSMLLTGQGFTQLRDIASNLEIPCMAKETFQRRQRHLSSVIKEVAWRRMQEAGREEASLALEVGEVDEDGVPVITVVTDGAWSKRSYGTNFNALSGVSQGCLVSTLLHDEGIREGGVKAVRAGRGREGTVVLTAATVAHPAGFTARPERPTCSQVMNEEIRIKDDPVKQEPCEITFPKIKEEIKEEFLWEDDHGDSVVSCAETSTAPYETAARNNTVVKDEMTFDDSLMCQQLGEDVTVAAAVGVPGTLLFLSA